MPELPEVETTCRGIQAILHGNTINRIIIRNHRLRWPIPPIIKKLKNLKVLKISRRAKYILLETSKGCFIIHLGMSGRLKVVAQNEAIRKHDHVDFILANEKILRYTDPRRFGAILWTSDAPLNHPLFAKLGPEPFAKEFNEKYLFAKANKKKITIKQLIMDQTTVVGVGNIYACEALFVAKLLPTRLSSSLTLDECKQLILAIQKILKQAIKAGGTTLKDFLSIEGNPGYFLQKLLVYGRENKQCVMCNTLLKNIRINQRATVFCENCQH